MDVRSYRRVFDLERRIYRVDRLRLNPSGVPLRGVVYFITLLAAAVVSARTPVVDLIAGAAPWYLRDIALPGVLAALLAIVRVDGRPFHLAAHAIARFRVGPRRLVGLRAERDRVGTCWAPAPITIVPDGSDARIRRFRYAGPGAVRVAIAHERRAARGPRVGLRLRTHLTVRQVSGASAARESGGEVIVLDRGARLSTR